MSNATLTQKPIDNDPVNHPSHYTSHPARCKCGEPIECIQITEHMGFNLGNATKYVWRCDLKKDAIEDLKKARWYLDREIEKREKLETELSSGFGQYTVGDVTFNVVSPTDPSNIATDILSKKDVAKHVG